MGPLPGPLDVVQGRQYRGHREAGYDEVRIGPVRIYRFLVRPAGDVGEPREGREHDAKAGLTFQGTASAHHGGAKHDDPGIDLLQLTIAQPPVFHSSRCKVFSHEVRPGGQPQYQVPGPGMSHGDGDAILVDVVVCEVSAAVQPGDIALKGSGPPQRLRPLGRLYPHHGCAVLGQVLGGQRADGDPAEVQHLESLQSQPGRHITPPSFSALSSSAARPSSSR